MELLINKTDVEKYFQVAIGRKDAEFEKYIRQAQLFDLKKIMPEIFFYDLLKNKAEANYQQVINGAEYVYDGNEYEQEGLKAVLAHFTYGLYIFKSGIQDTSFGMVVKQSQQSEPVEYKERRDWYYEHKAQANQIWEDVKRFIERNIDDYPVWTDCTTVRETRTFKTKLIQ
ncbi:MAG: hypothetical protein ACK5JD_10740 [Mangrovibacterium sp.]